jgi:hypothetical protein
VYQFAIENPKYNKSIIELNFDFSYQQLLQLERKVDWDLLSENRNIQWDDDVLLQFKDKWDYEELCQNPSVAFTKIH